MLRIRGLVSGYGDIEILHGVDLEVGPGEIVALVGSNGAGKTTLLRTVAGLITPMAGRVELEGRDVTRLRAAGRVKAGVALVPEGRRLFAALTVEQNLLLGAYTRSDHAAVRRDLVRIYGLFPVLGARPNQPAGSLSGGEQQMCTIGRGLMSAPRILMIDELSLGLSPVAIDGLLLALRQLHGDGLTILLVEQDVQTALETGSIVLGGSSGSLLADPMLRSAYLGL